MSLELHPFTAGAESTSTTKNQEPIRVRTSNSTPLLPEGGNPPAPTKNKTRFLQVTSNTYLATNALAIKLVHYDNFHVFKLPIVDCKGFSFFYT